MNRLAIPFIVGGFALFSPSALAAAPRAVDDARSVPIGTPITIDVLSNDSDPDGDTIRILGITRGPANGTATIVGNAIRYQPRSGFADIDTFEYAVIDATEDVSAPAVVTINVSDGVLKAAARAGNDTGVASALDAACAQLLQTEGGANAGQQQLRQRCSMLQRLAQSDSDAAARVINMVAPEETVAMIQVAGSGSQNHSDAVSQRLTGIGRGVNSISINGLSHNFGHVLGGAAGDGIDAPRGGFFASVQLETADKDKTELENGFDYDSRSITVGADYFLNHRWIVGAAAGWGETELEYHNEDGFVEATMGTLITYSSFNYDNWSADVQLGYSGGDYDIGRHIRYDNEFESLDTTTQGSTSGEQYSLKTQWQFVLNHRALTLYPSVKLGFQVARIADYAENNAAGFEVLLGDQRHTTVTAELGLQAQYVVNFNWGVLVPLAEVNLVSELISEQDDVTGRFAFSPANNQRFVMAAENGDSAFYNASIGSSFVLPNGISGFVHYDRTLGYRHFISQRFETGVRVEF